MEICDKFLCVNRKNKECHVPKNVVAFTCKHTNAPCPKARCEYCSVKCGKNCDWRIDRMSISEQVKALRELADGYKMADRPLAANTIYQAADTIESLSAKLADMERSAEDCGGGWITDKAPKESGNYFITTDTVVMGEVDSGVAYWDGESWNTFANIYAWKPIKFPEPYLPEPYHEP